MTAAVLDRLHLTAVEEAPAPEVDAPAQVTTGLDAILAIWAPGYPAA